MHGVLKYQFRISLSPSQHLSFPNAIKHKGGMQGLKTVNRKSNIVKSEMARKTEGRPSREMRDWDDGRGKC
jgi:hypothetical protein